MQRLQFRRFFTLCALAGALSQAANAAPIGWYDVGLTWRDGSFSGQFFYDSSSPYKITQVNGSLTDTAHTVNITDVWNVSHDDPEPWVMLNNASAADPDGYDTGFYLNLVDLPDALSLDTSQDNGLYDWSSDFAYFNNPGEQLNDSPLTAWHITPVQQVPEPASLALIGLGLLGQAVARKKRSRKA